MNRILILDDDPLTLYCTLGALRQRDYLMAAASGTEQARLWLADWPIDLLIAADRIGSESMLEFVATARVRHPELAAILLGNDGDQRRVTEARRQGVILLLRPYDTDCFLMVVAETLASIRQRQRWPRKRVRRAISVRIADTMARLIDVSYGGLRFSVTNTAAVMRSPITVGFPGGQSPIRAELVWSALAKDGASCQCGAAVLDEAPLAGWRHFVDQVPQEA